ncbi:adenine deaminase [Enterococcus hulanensis]|uniref:adenine deaminase n=1 Tax=Enterococcus TaxID=1350 RepID=UPI000B5A9662|nr:adenine deaminase [Enterococcus sp. 3H8_DIV0648]MBO0413500.1 adenine deaminase [Enterococcus hulanensis]OTO15010.1 adenine deaminase [Enterococcus sp. 3H8_DIV0648]
MDKKTLKRLIDVAAGRVPADLVLKNAQVIDVYQAEIMQGDVAIVDGRIAGINGAYEGKETVDLKGKFVAPGFIDPHIHVESSYVTPEEFGRLLVPHGTTTVLADPHEIVNVLGLHGLDYMVEAAKETVLDIRYMMPSCVPATNMENAGAVVEAADMIPAFEKNQVDGLAEFMNFPGVINAQDEVLDKLLAAKERGLRIDGHSPMIFNEELNAYAAAGIANDHECSTVQELKDRIARGMYVFLREGSVTQNLRTLLKGVTDNNYQRCVLSADDLQAKTMLEKGHLDNSIRICIEEGVPPIRAIQMATINAAQCCQLTDRGAIAPGLRADLVIFSDLAQVEIEATYIAGELIAENGKYLPAIKRISTENVQSSVHIDNFRKEQLALNLTSSKARAIEVIPQEALTNEAIVSVQRDIQGGFVFDPQQDVTKIAVIERHHNTGNVFVGLLKDYGLKKGAIGLSIAHDSHNLIVTGTNDEDMAAAVHALKEQEGGVVLIESGEVIGSMALPIAGLMSDLSGEEVAAQEAEINRLAHEVLGVSEKVDPIMTLGFMSLAVIPNLKITDIGLVDVTKFEVVPVSVEE